MIEWRLAKDRLLRFFFPESDQWVTLLRIGLGIQLLLYCLSIKGDWNYFLASTGGGFLSRNLAEAIVDLDSPLIPRLGWCVSLAARFGIAEQNALTLIWWLLLAASVFLLFGLFSRGAAIVSWFLHLAAVKSTLPLSYGRDELTTIGLFYLMLAPLPDAFSIDARWRRTMRQDRHLLGFFRRALQLHLCLIYFFSGLTKSLGAGWWNGSNLWRALTRPPFSAIDPHLLVQAKGMLPVAGIFIWLLELTFPFLIWCKRTRAAAFGCILAMHIGIAASMRMYLFATVMIVLNLAAFGPRFVWSPSNREIWATEKANVGLRPTGADHSDLVST